MSKKKDGSGGKMTVTLATTGGVFLLRKLMAFAWTKIRGKEPPTDLTDPKITLTEALAWAVFTAIMAEAARFWIARATGQRREPEAADAESD